MDTSALIRDWGDGYVALHHRADDLYGSLTIHLSGDQWERWPCTRGADVLRMAVFLDPHVTRLAQRSDRSAALVQRWRSCVAEAVRDATPNPSLEYEGNRRFWAQVLSVCVRLASELSPLPPQAEWAALLAQLGATPRNAAPAYAPFGPFEGVSSYGDLYIAQLRKLIALRGADRRTPDAGMTGGARSIPRTTVADVRALRDFWSTALGSAPKVLGHDAVARRWAGVVGALDAQTQGADAAAVYPQNNAFWRALASVATQVAVADESPTQGARIASSLKQGVVQAPGVLAGGAKAVLSEAAEVTSEVASGVGKVAGSVLKGLFSAPGLPLLVGGGALGAWLLLRGRSAAPASGAV